MTQVIRVCLLPVMIYCHCEDPVYRPHGCRHSTCDTTTDTPTEALACRYRLFHLTWPCLVASHNGGQCHAQTNTVASHLPQCRPDVQETETMGNFCRCLPETPMTSVRNNGRCMRHNSSPSHFFRAALECNQLIALVTCAYCTQPIAAH